MMATECSTKLTLNDKSMPSSHDYQLPDILCTACESTAQSSDSARMVEVGNYNPCREYYMLDVIK